MDEPLAALDEARKDEILPYLERLCDQSRVPIIYVTHTVAEVARLAHDMVVLRDGRVLRAGAAVEVLSDPEAVPMVGSRDAGAVIEARIVAQHEDGLTELAVSAGRLWLPRIEAAIGDQLRLRIPAQDVILARARPEGLSALNILPVTVTEVKVGEGPGAVVQLRRRAGSAAGADHPPVRDRARAQARHCGARGAEIRGAGQERHRRAARAQRRGLEPTFPWQWWREP